MTTKTDNTNLTVTRFFQARAAWQWELAEAVLNYNRCGMVIHGRNQLSAVGGPRTTQRSIKQFKELLKVIRQMTSHLRSDKSMRKSLSAGMADVLINEFVAASKPLPKSVQIYMEVRSDFTTRSRQYDSDEFRQGQKSALNLVG